MRSAVVIIPLVLWANIVFAGDDEQLKKTLDEAQAAFNQAVALQGGWESTKKLLADAELSAARGDKDAAMKQAEQAKREAQDSLAQAQGQQKAWSEPPYITGKSD